ncbi:MAG: hypothetical protein AB7G93_21580 [Bdellovibrionales bacterium]
MGRVLVCLLFGLGTWTYVVQANTVSTKEVYISISDVFIPDGPKSNGNSYVVVNGLFPNSCYRWSRAEVKDRSGTEHEIRLVATVSQTMCLMVLVPYSKEVVLGQLSRGEHTLRFVNGDGTFFERSLTVQ